jgi:hypothetical protein
MTTRPPRRKRRRTVANPDPIPDMTDWELRRQTETLMAITECDDAAGIVDTGNATAWQANVAVRAARMGRK